MVWVSFVLLCLVWGSSYLFIRLGLRQLTPLSLVALRLLGGAITIGVFSLWRRQNMRVTQRQFATLVLVATINTSAPFLLISWGELSVPTGLASVLNSTMPIFSVVLAALVLRDEPVTLARAGGVILGFLGVIVLLSRDLVHGGIQWHGIAGQGAIVLASLCYAVGAVLVRRALRGLPSLVIAAYAVAISAIQVFALSMIFSRPEFGSFHLLTVVSILWLGVGGSGIAYIWSYSILEHWGAARYSLVAYVLPITGVTLGIIVLHEVFSSLILAGSVLVVAGVILASFAKARPEDRTDESSDREAATG